MFLEVGDARVLPGLLAQRDNPDPSRKFVLLILSGGTRGAYGGGAVMALEQLGLTHVFDEVYGISTGILIGLYFMSGQAEVGTSIYFDECTRKEFIDRFRVVRGKRAMDIDWLNSVFKGQVSDKALDFDSVHRSPTKMWFSATHATTGETTWFDIKELDDPFQGLKAGISAPGASDWRVPLRGTHFTDGAASPFPVMDIIERTGATDLLVIANCSEKRRLRGQTGEQILLRLLAPTIPSALYRKFGTRNAEFTRSLATLRSQSKCRFAIQWTDDLVTSSFEQDRGLLREASERSTAHLLHEFACA